MPKTFQVKGIDYEFPDHYSDDQAEEILAQQGVIPKRAAPATAPATAKFSGVQIMAEEQPAAQIPRPAPPKLGPSFINPKASGRSYRGTPAAYAGDVNLRAREAALQKSAAPTEGQIATEADAIREADQVKNFEFDRPKYSIPGAIARTGEDFINRNFLNREAKDPAEPTIKPSLLLPTPDEEAELKRTSGYADNIFYDALANPARAALELGEGLTSQEMAAIGGGLGAVRAAKGVAGPIGKRILQGVESGVSGKFAYDMGTGAVDQGGQAIEAIKEGDLPKALYHGTHAVGSGVMAAGAGLHAAQSGTGLARTVRADAREVSRDQQARARGLPFAAPEPTPIQRVWGEFRQMDPGEHWQDRLSAMSDDDLLATRAGEDNPFRRGMASTEIKRREKLNVWRPTVEAPPQPINRATRRESLAVPEPDLQLVADELGLGKFEDLSLEDQAAVRGVRDEAAGLTRGPSAQPPVAPIKAAPVAPPPVADVAARPESAPMEMPPWVEYRGMQAGVQRGLGNIEAIRELRDEAARKPVETDPFVMKPAAESAEVFAREPVPGPGSAAESAAVFQGQIQPTGRPAPGVPEPKVDAMRMRREEMAQAIHGKPYADLNVFQRGLVERGLREDKGRRVASAGEGRVAGSEGRAEGPVGPDLSRLDLAADEARGRLKSAFRGETLSANPVGLIGDFAIIGAQKLINGVKDFNAWAKEMTAEYGPAIQQHLKAIYDQSVQWIAEQAPEQRQVSTRRLATQRGAVPLYHEPRIDPEPPGKGPRLAEAAEAVKEKRELVISPNADKSVVKLVEKSGLSEDGKISLWASIDHYMADNPQRKVMSDAEYRDLAEKVDPGYIRSLDASKITRDNLPSREVMEAAVAWKDVVQAQLVEKTMEAASQPENTPVEVKESRAAEINRLNEDLSHLLDIIIPVRSEHGRNLRMWRTMAAQGLDPAYWIARARRTARLPADVALPGDAETKIKDTLTETQAAENEAMDQVTAIDRGKQKIREGAEKAKAKAKPAVELSREERIEQARKQTIKRLQAELNGKRITDTLTPEERALIADDPEVQELRARVHELRSKSRPVKSADEMVASEIERERKRLSKVLEGEPVTARVDKLTPEQRKLVDTDPGLQSLKARIREQRAQDQMKRRNAAVPEEHKVERAAGLEMDKLERKGEALAEAPVQRPKSKWDLTPEQRAQVDRDPRVIASRRKLANLMADLQKSTTWDVAMAFRRANMLSALATHGRNWIGNTAFQLSEEAARIPSSIVDAVLSNFPTSEGRTVEGVNAKAVVRALDEMRTRGHREAKQIMRHGTSDADLMKANPEFARSLNSRSEVLNAYVNTVLRSMSAADRYFRVYAYERSIGEQMRLAGVERPTAAMETRAIADAEYATFNGKNKVSDAISWAKRSSPEAAAGVDLIVPFVKTPTNIALRVLDYTPLGLLRGVNAARKAIGGKSLTPEYQRAISQSIGRATVGSALMLLGYKWAEDQAMTGNRPDNPSEARGDEVAGQPWGSRKAFGRWWRTSSMAPVGSLLVVGAALYEASHQREVAGMSDDDKWWQGFWSVGGTALRTIADQPMVQGADMMKRVVDKPKNSLPYMAGSMVSSFVPGSSAVAGIAAAFDDKRRETRADNPMESAVNVVAARIPGWRNALPEKVDALGQTVPQNRFQGIDPFSSQDAKQDDDVAQALAAEDISFGKPAKIKGESDEAYRWRLRVRGAAQRRAIETTIRSDAYRRAGAMKDGSDERLELIKDAREQGTKAEKAMTGAKWYKNWTNEQRLDVLRRSFEKLTRK